MGILLTPVLVLAPADSIVGCCPLVMPSAFMYSSWDGVTTDWGDQLQHNRQIYNLLNFSPEEQHFPSNLF
jgi:hypothetical protein